MATKKTKTEPKKKHVDNPNVIGLHSEVMEPPITQTARAELHALCHEHERVARIPGNRRLQAVAPQAALHHVQNGPAERRTAKKREHRRPNHEAQPARRFRYLRDHGASRHGQRSAARAVRRIEGQLRRNALRRPELCGLALHRSQALADLRRDFQRHRQRPGRLRGQLRRSHEGAATFCPPRSPTFSCQRTKALALPWLPIFAAST